MLSARALLDLTGTPIGIQSAGVLYATGNSPSPFAQGLTSEDFEQLVMQGHGESFRYWDAFTAPGENRSGKTYVEKALPATARGLFYQSKTDVESEQFGLIPTGSTMFSCLPDVCEISGDGYILRNTAAQYRIGKAVITRGGGAFDVLPERFVRSITRVIVNGASVSLATVQAVAAAAPGDSEQGGLTWLSGAPAAGTKVFVLFRYSPLFVALGESVQDAPTGADNKRLPQRVLLRKERE